MTPCVTTVNICMADSLMSFKIMLKPYRLKKAHQAYNIIMDYILRICFKISHIFDVLLSLLHWIGSALYIS